MLVRPHNHRLRSLPNENIDRPVMNSPDKLVRLYLVAPIHVEPTPDKAVLGRFERILRGVGATGSIAVRARMITLIAGTKFKTVSGLPVSLVGLQGKDDLLVLGPPWALELLSAGKALKTPVDGGPRDFLLDARTVVQEEIDFVKQVPDFLASLQGSSSATQIEICDPSFAKEMLQAIFRTKIEVVTAYFEHHEPVAFSSEMVSEARQVLAAIDQRLEGGVDNYYAWWLQWDKGQEVQGEDPSETKICITKSGRHVTVYPVKGSNVGVSQKPRTKSLTGKWRELTNAQPLAQSER